MHQFNKTSITTAIAAVLGSSVVMGHAFAGEGDTFTPYYSSSIVYDSNLLRIDDDNPDRIGGVRGRSDTLKKNLLGLNVDWEYSRQKLLVRAAVSENDFNRFNSLDYQGRYLKTQWNYQLGNQVSGNIGQVFNRALASFNDIRGLSGNLRDQQSRFFNMNYLLHPRWKTGFSYTENEVEYEAAIQKIGDFQNRTVGLGLDYETPKGSGVGVKVTQEDGKYPNRSVTEASTLDDGYSENKAALNLKWQYSVKTSFHIKTAYVERDYDNISERDYDAIDKRVSVVYQPSAKTQLKLSVFDETYPRDDLQASVSEHFGQSLEVSWLPTSKLTFQARYKRENREDLDNPGFVIGPVAQREDDNDSLSFTLNYEPHENINFTAGYNRMERDSSVPLGDFEADVFSLTATIKM